MGKMWIGILIVVVLVAAGIWAYTSMGSSVKTVGQSPTSNFIASTPTKEAFASFKDVSFAYQILPGPISSNTQEALAGFTLTQNPQSDGSIMVKIDSEEYNLHNQINVPKGDSFYIIERMMGDDKDNKEYNLKEDYFVLVDASGYIVQKWPQQA